MSNKEFQPNGTPENLEDIIHKKLTQAREAHQILNQAVGEWNEKLIARLKDLDDPKLTDATKSRLLLLLRRQRLYSGHIQKTLRETEMQMLELDDVARGLEAGENIPVYESLIDAIEELIRRTRGETGPNDLDSSPPVEDDMLGDDLDLSRFIALEEVYLKRIYDSYQEYKKMLDKSNIKVADEDE